MLWLMRRIQEKAANDFSLVALKAIIIAVALVFIIIALTVNNKWVLGGALAYELLP